MFFTHGPQRWNHGSTDGLFLLLLLLLLQTTNLGKMGVKKKLCANANGGKKITLCKGWGGGGRGGYRGGAYNKNGGKKKTVQGVGGGSGRGGGGIGGPPIKKWG